MYLFATNFTNATNFFLKNGIEHEILANFTNTTNFFLFGLYLQPKTR